MFIYISLLLLFIYFTPKKTRLGYVSLFLLQLENEEMHSRPRRVNARYIFAATKKHLTHSHV